MIMQKDITMKNHFFIVAILLVFLSIHVCANDNEVPQSIPKKSLLSPVYAPLAEWITNRYQLLDKEGIGIDIGSGKGDLIIELCKRTNHMYWINVDIKPSVYAIYFDKLIQQNLAHRAGGDMRRCSFSSIL
jgi:hypothetical protein